MNDILIAVTDGLKGMPEALAPVFPATTLQTCIVHLIRNSLDYANWKDRKALAAALKPIYTAANGEAAAAEEHHGRLGPRVEGLERSHEPIRDPLRRSLHDSCRLRCGADLPTASCVRRKRRPPPWASLSRPHTKIETTPCEAIL